MLDDRSNQGSAVSAINESLHAEIFMDSQSVWGLKDVKKYVEDEGQRLVIPHSTSARRISSSTDGGLGE